MISSENKQTKTVLQYDLNKNFIKEWVSMSTAANALNINISNISNVCHKKVKTTGGFIFEFKYKQLKLNPTEQSEHHLFSQYIMNAKKRNLNNSKKLYIKIVIFVILVTPYIKDIKINVNILIYIIFVIA